MATFGCTQMPQIFIAYICVNHGNLRPFSSIVVRLVAVVSSDSPNVN
jgi:hypothetical protein